jgi:hypothetical protein
MDVIQEYAKAYEALHGKPPKIEKRGGWLAIGDWFPVKVRKSQLPSMISQLRYRAEQKSRGA